MCCSPTAASIQYTVSSQQVSARSEIRHDNESVIISGGA